MMVCEGQDNGSGLVGDQEGHPPDVHKNKVTRRARLVGEEALPHFDLVLDLVEQRNAPGVGSPPLERPFDDPCRPNKPLLFGLGAKVHNVHFHVLVIQVRQGERTLAVRGAVGTKRPLAVIAGRMSNAVVVMASLEVAMVVEAKLLRTKEQEDIIIVVIVIVIVVINAVIASSSSW